jgi:3-dehydroquinate dehydratase type I
MICVPIIAHDTEEALQKISEAARWGDMFELRLDLMTSFDLDVIVRAASKPVMATYRSEAQGGKGSPDPKIYTEHVLAALRAEPDLVDVELWLPSELRKTIFDSLGLCKVVLSTHFHSHTPSQEVLEKILQESVKAGADIVKIITRAASYADNLRVLGLIPKALALKTEIIAFCMGSEGRSSRIFSHLLGGYLTFASLKEGEESGDGQIPVASLKEKLEKLSP